MKDVLQLLRTEGESAVQPLFNKTQNTAAEARNKSLKDINETVAITTAASDQEALSFMHGRPGLAASRADILKQP